MTGNLEDFQFGLGVSARVCIQFRAPQPFQFSKVAAHQPTPFKAMEAIDQVVEAITSAGYHAQMAATFSAAAVEAAKKAAVLAQLAEEHSRLAVEKAKPPNAEPAEAAEPAQPAEPTQPVEPAEPAPKRQRMRSNCSGTELRAEEVELMRLAEEQAAEQADEPHDAGAWDRYLEAGMDSHFGVEQSPELLPLDSPLNSPDW